MGTRMVTCGIALVAVLIASCPRTGTQMPSTAIAAPRLSPAAMLPLTLKESSLTWGKAAAARGLILSPASGLITQSVTVQLSPAVVAASHGWPGFYLLWDGAQTLFDGGGAPPASVSFTPAELETLGGTRATTPGRHTVGLYDTVVNGGTMEPHTLVASATFTIISPHVGQDTGPDIYLLDVPSRVQGGTKLTVSLWTDPRAEVELILHVPGTRGGPPLYDLDVTAPVDSRAGVFSLSILMPHAGRDSVGATLGVLTRLGSGVTRRTFHITVTPTAPLPPGTVAA